MEHRFLVQTIQGNLIAIIANSPREDTLIQAMIVRNWGEAFSLEERPDPRPELGEAVMKVHAAGVGLTLVTMRTGIFGGTTPRVMGHELGGEIISVGARVSNVKPGQRCVVYFY